MLKLFKYEMRKTLLAKLIILGLTVCLEGFFLYTNLINKNVNQATTAALLLLVVAILGIFYMGIQSVVTLHHDMNTKQSYMLFMTPHSNYAILGAKVLECMLSIFIAGAFFFALGMLDIDIMLRSFGNVDNLMDFIKQMLASMGLDKALDLIHIAAVVLNIVAAWVCAVVLAYFADVLITAIMKGRKFGGLLVFILYLLLDSLLARVIGLIPSFDNVMTKSLVELAAYLAIAAVVYIGTATVMEKKLSV